MTRLSPGLRDPLAVAGLLLSVGLYTAALFLPAIEDTAGNLGEMSGREVLLFVPKMVRETALVRMGVKALPDLPYDFGTYNLMMGSWVLRGWLPNPLFWAGAFGLAAGRRHLPWALGSLVLLR
jgi:hypothetical protein